MKKVIAISKEIHISVPDEKINVYLEKFSESNLINSPEDTESLFQYIALAYADGDVSIRENGGINIIGKEGEILIHDIEISETEFALF